MAEKGSAIQYLSFAKACQNMPKPLWQSIESNLQIDDTSQKATVIQGPSIYATCCKHSPLWLQHAATAELPAFGIRWARWLFRNLGDDGLIHNLQYPNFDGKAQQGLKWRKSSGRMHVKYCNMLALEHHLKFSKWLIVNAMLAILAPESAFLCRRYKDFYRIMFTYKASNFIKPHVRSPPSTTRLADRWRQSARGSTDL
jgi:hypothetical protein